MPMSDHALLSKGTLEIERSKLALRDWGEAFVAYMLIGLVRLAEHLASRTTMPV